MSRRPIEFAEAAVIGMVAATAVGAVAGLLPALVAVWVKVIDAIRYGCSAGLHGPCASGRHRDDPDEAEETVRGEASLR